MSVLLRIVGIVVGAVPYTITVWRDSGASVMVGAGLWGLCIVIWTMPIRPNKKEEPKGD